MNDDWAPFTAAGPVREHLEQLRSAGVGVDRIAELAGVPRSTVRELIYGSGGRLFAQVRSDTAARLLGTLPVADIRSERSTVDATATRASIESLRSQGLAWAVIADGLGRTVGNLRRTLQRSKVTVRTANDVARLCSSSDFRSNAAI